jgi:hypothetical protein
MKWILLSSLVSTGRADAGRIRRAILRGPLAASDWWDTFWEKKRPKKPAFSIRAFFGSLKLPL